jgi:hypothetical protein
MLPLAPWLAFDGAVDGASLQSANLSDNLLDAVRIFQVGVLLTQPDDSHPTSLFNFTKIRVFGTSKLEQNILANTIVLAFAMFWILLLWSRRGAKAADLTPPDQKIPETTLEHDLEATL